MKNTNILCKFWQLCTYIKHPPFEICLVKWNKQPSIWFAHHNYCRPLSDFVSSSRLAVIRLLIKGLLNFSEEYIAPKSKNRSPGTMSCCCWRGQIQQLIFQSHLHQEGISSIVSHY